MNNEIEITAAEAERARESSQETPQAEVQEQDSAVQEQDSAVQEQDSISAPEAEEVEEEAETEEVAAPGELPQSAADTTGQSYTESEPASPSEPAEPFELEAQDDPNSASVLDLMPAEETHSTAEETEVTRMLAVLEAVVYVTDEPLTLQQIALALNEPVAHVKQLLDRLVDEYNKPEHGLTVKEVAGGYKMATKAEHHEAVRAFVKNLNPPMKLSLAALETLAVIAYKQPITAPEIMEIRGVQGAGVLKTLLERKVITTAGRKQVVGKPILYRTTKEFLVQFGLKDLTELPSLKEFEELRRLAFSDADDQMLEETGAVDGQAPPEDAEAELLENGVPDSGLSDLEPSNAQASDGADAAGQAKPAANQQNE